MTALTEGKNASEVLLSEGNGSWSREEVTIVNGTGVVKVGDVLGKITSSGKYEKSAVKLTQNDPGSGDAVAVAITGCDATSADAKCVIVARGAEVNKNQLSYASDVSDDTKKAAKHAMLAGVGIIVR